MGKVTVTPENEEIEWPGHYPGRRSAPARLRHATQLLICAAERHVDWLLGEAEAGPFNGIDERKAYAFRAMIWINFVRRLQALDAARRAKS